MTETAPLTTYVDQFGHLCVTAANRVPFLVRYVKPGDGYGVGRSLTLPLDSEPEVEFYDRRYAHDMWTAAQFTGGRYHVSTLLGEGQWAGGSGALNLAGGVPDWTVDADTMGEVRAWVRGMRDGFAAAEAGA